MTGDSQSLSRIHRIGQKNRCTYIHLVSEKTIDETILQPAQGAKRSLIVPLPVFPL